MAGTEVVPKYRISVDPGSKFTGVALWDASEEVWAKPVPPIKVALLQPRLVASAPFEDRATDIGLQFDEEFFSLGLGGLKRTGVVEVASEFPEIFGSAGSMAAGIRGDLHKVAFLVGCVAMVAAQHGVPLRPVLVREWKGQLSKEQVIKRIVHVLGPKGCQGFERDIWDAVGVGLWLKGFL